MKAAKIARGAWIPTHDPSCYESATELNAALDEFGRLPLYMGNLMTRAKALGAMDAYVAVNDYRKEVARWNPTASVGLCSAASAPDTTIDTLPSTGIDTTDTVSVELTVEGPIAVDSPVTVADNSAACDGRSPFTRFWLMRYASDTNEWVLEDFARSQDGTTSAKLTPQQPGEHRVGYFGYCGTKDRRNGSADFTVPGLDITAGPSATTATGTSAARTYAIVDTAATKVPVRGDATHVIIEPEVVSTWLGGDQNPTRQGTVTARMNGGAWTVLSSRFATAVPVGTDATGIETDIVGIATATRTVVRVTDTTTTTTTTTNTASAPTSTAAGAEATPTPEALATESTNATGDATIWVILGLFGLAAAAVFLARLRLL